MQGATVAAGEQYRPGVKYQYPELVRLPRDCWFYQSIDSYSRRRVVLYLPAPVSLTERLEQLIREKGVDEYCVGRRQHDSRKPGSFFVFWMPNGLAEYEAKFRLKFIITAVRVASGLGRQ